MSEDRPEYGSGRDPGVLLRFPSDTLARDIRAALDLIGLTMDPHAEVVPGCGETVYRVSRRAHGGQRMCSVCGNLGTERPAVTIVAGAAYCAEHFRQARDGVQL